MSWLLTLGGQSIIFFTKSYLMIQFRVFDTIQSFFKDFFDVDLFFSSLFFLIYFKLKDNYSIVLVSAIH